MTTRIAKGTNKQITRIGQIGHLVGNTPLYPITGVSKKEKVQVAAKLEWLQLGGSVKSRAAYFIIRDAILRGQLNGGKILLDASSGNTGISYAAICAAMDIPLTLCIPANASKERKQLLEYYGATIEYTSPFESTDGAQQRARELANAFPQKYYYADQYNNRNNWWAHYNTTAQEIWDQSEGNITHFVAGLGTTGTFMGTSRRLKELNPNIKVIALQPNNPMHGLEGWKHLETAKVPGIFDHKLADEVLEVDTLEAFELVKNIANTEGLLLSPSAAANLLGARKVAEKLDSGYVVTTFADSSEKYGEVYKQIFNED